MRRTPLLLAAGLGLVLFRLFAAPAALAQSPAVPDVIYIPTPQPVVEAMLAVADVKENDIVYDLGSGDGRIVITAAKKYGARGVGIEIDPALVKKATENAVAAGVSDRVRFVTRNLFTSDISEATVVTLYLLQSINERLRPKLIRELKPRTRVVSHVFNMGPEWPPEKTLVVERRPIFLWTIPDRTTPDRAGAQPSARDTQNATAQAEEEFARVGEATTDRACSTSCHTFEDITRTRRTARDWNDMVTSMATRGAAATDEQLATIRQYLTRYFGLVSVNTASAEELSAVLGLSSKDAKAIVEHRRVHGKFADAAALSKVQGIDKTRIEAQPDALRFN